MWLLKNRIFQLCIGALLGLGVLLLPRPEGRQFEISGDPNRALLAKIQEHFKLAGEGERLVSETGKKERTYIVESLEAGQPESTAAWLTEKMSDLGLASTVMHDAAATAIAISAMLLVIGCPPNAISYSHRQFKALDLTKAGLVATPILLGLLVAVAAVWWKILGLV